MKWCQVTKDGRLAHCMYVSAGSVREAADGGFIHVLIDDQEVQASETPPPRAKQNLAIPLAPLAPLYVRHAAYKRLIELSPAWSYEEELVLGLGGLRERGLPAGYSARFGALPPEELGRDLLAAKVEGYLRERFPDYAEECVRACAIGVPCFWRERGGQLKLGTEGNKARPALIIPYRDRTGTIQACQLRVSHGEGKSYRWLSTSSDRAEEEPGGASSSSPLHWTFAASRRPDDAPIIVTEGALKAEVFARHAPGSYVIATAGVGNSHEQILDAATGTRLLVGFDRDHRENSAVCWQIARLVRGRDARRERQSTEVLLWDGAKGIDDAAQAGVRIFGTTPDNWFRQLPVESQSEVAKIWCQMHHKMKI